MTIARSQTLKHTFSMMIGIHLLQEFPDTCKVTVPNYCRSYDGEKAA